MALNRHKKHMDTALGAKLRAVSFCDAARTESCVSVDERIEFPYNQNMENNAIRDKDGGEPNDHSGHDLRVERESAARGG